MSSSTVNVMKAHFNAVTGQATPSAIPELRVNPTEQVHRTTGGIVDNVLCPIPRKGLVSQFSVGSSAPWIVSISIIAFDASAFNPS